ncbi:MAG: CtpF protein [Hyphomicrobiales bacterium]|nr:CtpF protein [Hyphomicrobiales bacterium]
MSSQGRTGAALGGEGQIAAVPRVTIQAFCESGDTAAVMNSAATDRRMLKAHVKAHMGGMNAALEAYRSSPTPNVVVIESTSDRATILAQLEELSEYCDPGTKVIIVGRSNDIHLYRELISLGVSDYLVAPMNVLTFVTSVSNIYASDAGKNVGRVTAILGAKGGVGSSTIAHNIAYNIATSYEAGTVLVDFDLGFGTAGLNLNQDPVTSLGDIVQTPERADSNILDRLMVKCSDHLSLLAAPAMLDTTYDVPDSTFETMLDTLRATTPNIILDLPHTWTAWVRRTIMAADDVILVAAPDLANLRNARNLLDVLNAARPNDAKPRLIMNMVGVQKRPEIAITDFAKALDLEPMAIVPFDAKLFGAAANNGQMLAELEPNNKVTETLLDVTKALMGRAEPKPVKRNLLGPLASLLGRKAS